MSDFFYDGQTKRYITQFMRIMSNFSYKDAKGNLTRVPVRYGDMSRQVGALLKKNSENTIPSAPFIACYIKDMQFDQSRMQDPTFISKVQIREQALDPVTGQYVINQQGANYTVERMMPSPYLATFNADIWTTNTDQKLQIFEQLAVLFNPSLELQTTDNYIDWTSISVLTLKSHVWSSRSVPQGLEQDIDVLSMTFETHVWITPPVKVKKLGIITKIIASVFSTTQGTIADNFSNPNAVLESLGTEQQSVIVTPGNFDLLVLDNVASLLSSNSTGISSDLATAGVKSSWVSLLNLYPGQFRAGLSQLRLTKPDGNEIVARISLDPLDEFRMVLAFDYDTIPTNTVIEGPARSSNSWGTVDAIINPETHNPTNKITGTRYLILGDINSDPVTGPAAWLQNDGSGFNAFTNDIIEWDGNNWSIVFNSSATKEVTYITNAYTGVQYKWDGSSWSKSFEGIYNNGAWRLIL
jgi:hypothetical protein